MKKYTIPVNWVQVGLVNITAESLSEAVEIVDKLDFSMTPVLGNTLPDSIRVSYSRLSAHVEDEFLSEGVKLYVSGKMEKCPFCEQARKYFNENNIEYTEIDIDKDSESLAYLEKQLKSISVPVIEIGNEIIIGFNKEKVEYLLRKYNVTGNNTNAD